MDAAAWKVGPGLSIALTLELGAEQGPLIGLRLSPELRLGLGPGQKLVEARAGMNTDRNLGRIRG